MAHLAELFEIFKPIAPEEKAWRLLRAASVPEAATASTITQHKM